MGGWVGGWVGWMGGVGGWWGGWGGSWGGRVNDLTAEQGAGRPGVPRLWRDELLEEAALHVDDHHRHGSVDVGLQLRLHVLQLRRVACMADSEARALGQRVGEAPGLHCRAHAAPALPRSPEGRRVQALGRLEPQVAPLPGPVCLTMLPVPSRSTASPRASPARPAGVCGWSALSTKENGRAVGGGAPRSSDGSCSAEPGAAVPVLCWRESSSAREGASIRRV